MITVAQARADRSGRILRDALARRRPAADGGAYTLLLEPSPAMAGPLSGVPVAVKDLIDVAGAPTRSGSRVRRDAPDADADAPVVAALRRAGAALVGKTALHEFAFGTTGVNDYEGTPRHPLDRERVVGGSSSGSAVAVAEGSAAAALGTDSGGSVRIPAALCGVVGVKPSWGLVSVVGVFPLSPTLDHVGVIAPDVASARDVLRVIAPSAAWVDAEPPRRLGIDRGAFETADPAVARRGEQALARLRGVALRDVALPDAELVFAVSTAIMFSEAAAGHARTLRERAGDYGRDVRERLAMGGAIAARTYIAALRERGTLRAALERLLEECDVIIGPTVPHVAPTLAEAADPGLPGRLVRNTRLANVVGFAAVSVPLPGDGLPIGLQLIARTDAAALSAAELVSACLR